MNSKTQTDPSPPSVATDARFKRGIVCSSAFLLAAVFGWLACVARSADGAVTFHWQWRALLWIAAGLGCTIYFWRQVWPAPGVSRSRRQEFAGWVVLAVPCVLWMAYPLRFISGPQLLNVFIGLAVAATVLTGGGFMVRTLIRGFENDEATTADPVAPNPPDRSDTRKEPASAAAEPKTLGRDA